mmetsp:Transcript_8061/g.15099  ORF Transcript_8061/g.15099 Transcript_8061/m.15099 type:complete len:346 (+) Transcript_8061:63-1100(+)
MATEEDPFLVLGLKADASQREVESAFRRRALRCHPDRHPEDPTAKARFERLSRAKEALLDPARNARAREAAAARHEGAQKQKAKSREAAEKARRRWVAAAKKQKESREKLRKREEAAAAERRHQQEQEAEAKRQAADAKRRCDEFFAEEDARQRAADQYRRREALFGNWWQKHKAARHSDDHGQSAGDAGSGAALPSALRALVERFAADTSTCRRPTLEIEDGPPDALSPAALEELKALAMLLGLQVKKEACHLVISRGVHEEKPDSDSPWEPPGGTRDAKKRHGMRLGQKRATMATRHRQALERLEARRRAGEGLQPTPRVGSWWVRDEEADRWARYLEQNGGI